MARPTRTRKSYREWILTPVYVAVQRPGFIHHEMAVQACISIESTNSVNAMIIKNQQTFSIALEDPSEFELKCAASIIDNLLTVDRNIS